MEGHRHTSTLEQKVDDILDIVVFLKDSMGEQFAVVNTRLDAMDKRFDGVDKRLDGMDSRFDGIDSRFDATDSRMDYLSHEVNALTERVVRIEDKVDILNKRTLEDTNSLARDILLHDVRISRLEKQQQ